MNTRPGLPARAQNVLRASAWLTTLLLLLAALLPATVSANDKVFVCKYVDTPQVDERLQTGQNPISVSVNAIPDFEGIGSEFADAHGRSVVIAWDTGQPEPDVSDCPGGGAAAEGDEPTLPPTNTTFDNTRSTADQGWQIAFAALAGILAFALAVRPERLAVRRDR